MPVRALWYSVLLIATIVCSTTGHSYQQRRVIYPSAPERVFHGIALRARESGDRPRVGIVLSGGGARGLAQIGVLKVLEAHHIPIDAIVGNSLGSVIGGMYAAGYTTSQIESVAINTDWSELLSFSEDTKRTDLFVGQREAQEQGYLLIRFEGLQPIIPSSISGGQRISNFFSTIALSALYHPAPSFDDLKIPFRAIATDLISGSRIILDRGSLAEAMRASVTVPLLYSPLDRDSMSLVDGGLTSNIPVDIAESLRCDIVIAVNSTSPMRRAGELGAPWEVADQIMTIMMQDANRRQLASADVVFSPDVGHRLVSDFSNVADIIRAGEIEALTGVNRIREIIASYNRRTSGLDSSRYDGANVAFVGDSLPAELRSEIMHDHRSKPVTTTLIRAELDRIAAFGYNPLAEVLEKSSPSEVIYHSTRLPVITSVEISGDGKEWVTPSLFDSTVGRLRGKAYNADSVQGALERILSTFRKKGYSLALIESVQLDPVRGTLSFIVHEGRIQQIIYEGNERTKDYIIRRELPLSEGDVFDAEQAYRGIVNVKSTELFEYVLLEVRYVDDAPILVVKVKEKSAELMRLGLHADNEHSLVVTVDIHDANFRGAWEDIGLLARYGYRDRVVQLNYTVNRIFHSYLTLNLKGYFRSKDVFTYTDEPALGPEQWDRIEEGKYRENKYGGSFAFGSHFERLGDVIAEVRLENQNIIALSGGGYTPERYQLAALKIQSTVDTEDEFWYPTSGVKFVLSYESAMKSLSSDVGYGKFSGFWESYLSLGLRHTLRPRFSIGFADATLPTAEQFSMGGFQSMYGLNEDDSRGRQLFVVNMEYRIWLPFSVIFDTYVKIRYDLGTISLQPEELKLINFHHGLGVQIDLATPLGPAAFGAGKSFYFRQDLPDSPVSVGPLLFYFSIGHAL